MVEKINLSNMKIGILTLHRANNYGAALQCYALFETLTSLGHDVSIIDYRQPDTELSYKAFSWSKIRSAIGNLHALIKVLLYIPYSIVQQWGFNHFRKKYLKCTRPVYRSDDMPQNFDLYIIGSDQLWSIQCMGGNIEPVFFGQFPHSKNSKVIGYAISSNIISLKTIGVELLNKYLPAFDCISLRESEIYDWIAVHTNFKLRQDIDPTLLCNTERWNILAGDKRPVKERYILMYFLLPEQKVLAKEFAQKTGLKLIEVGKVAFSPEKFLTYVKSADLILGGSFHVAVFSILFKKQFYIIKKNSEFDVRSEHLLRSVGLENRFIDVTKLVDLDIKNLQLLDYNEVEHKLSILRKRSLDYLRSL